MEYNEILVVLIIILVIYFLNSGLNIILLCNANNKDIKVNISIRYFFNLIKINFQIYPIKNKDKKEKKVKKEAKKVKNKIQMPSKKDLLQIYNSIKKIDIKEIYSDIYLGNENVYFVCFINLLINTIYVNLINIFNSEKVYLKITPNFMESVLKANIKLHIKITFKTIIEIGFKLLEVYIKRNKKVKEANKNERTWFNKKSYGNNSWKY